MTKKKIKRTKYVPTFVHPCDDFTITDPDGVEYHPHAGEVVRFRADAPFEMFTFDMGMTNAEYVEWMCNILLRQILDWTWTDNDEVEYAQPSDPREFVLALLDLSAEERSYLYNSCYKKADLGEENGSES